MRESKEGINLFLENLNNRLFVALNFIIFFYESLSIVKRWVVLVFPYYLYIFREKQIQAIEESFKASKLPPVHQTKPTLKPKGILPLLPYFDRYVLKCIFSLYCNEDLYVPLCCTVIFAVGIILLG